MLTKYVLPSVSAIGLCFAAVTIANSSRAPLVAAPAAQPASAPFTRFIAGAGIVEPSSRMVAVGSPLARCVREVHVAVGQQVEVGASLFTLDDRDLQARLAVDRTALAVAESKLGRLMALPRAEDLPPARARLAEAQSKQHDAEDMLARALAVKDARAISGEELTKRRHEAAAAAARAEQAAAELALLEAGAWKPDVEIALAERDAARAQALASEVELERLTVRAPVAGMVLQVEVKAGEFAPAGALDKPLMLLGNVDRLHVRVDIDENDAWRFRAGAKATASIRGNREIGTALRFEYLEPYVVPKRSLTGDTAERVDTRVLQVVFSFERGALPIQVGQQMDVFIEEARTENVVAQEGGIQ